MKNNKKVIVVAIFIIILLLLYLICCIPEAFRRVKYGSLKKIGDLANHRVEQTSIFIDNNILTYGGSDYLRNSLSDPLLVETYNVITNESIEQYELSNILKLYPFDIVMPWKNYLIVQRKLGHEDFLKNTIGYYNLQTKKFDIEIKTKDDDPKKMFVSDNGDIYLYNSTNAIKYLFKEKHFAVSNCKIRKINSSTSTTAIPLKDNSILVISTENAYIYKDNTCKPIEHIHFKANEFTNGFYTRIDAPFFIPLGNNLFAVFTFNPYEHLNKIVLYNINNSRIEAIQEFKTKKIPYSLNSGRIIKLDDHRIIVVGGTWRIYPPVFTLASNKIYIYDYKKNKLSQITSLQYFPYIYSLTSDYSVVVTPQQQLYIIGNYNIYNNKDIKMLDLSERGKNGN